MSILSLIGIELKKLRHSKIIFILLIPIILIFITAISGAALNFDVQAEGISPENNFFIQAMLTLVCFMLPISLVIITVLMAQTEQKNSGIRKMLSMPISKTKLCLSKFCVLITLMAVEILMFFILYIPTVMIASSRIDYDLGVSILYLLKWCGIVFITSIPMASIYWMISTCIKNTVISLGIGFLTVIPSIIMINISAWFVYPMCYPMKVLVAEQHKLATNLDSFNFELLPWIPVAAILTIISLIVACKMFGNSETE